VVDIKNGYIKLKYDLYHCTTLVQIAVFRGTRTDQRIVALRVKDDCSNRPQTIEHSLRFFQPEGDALSEMTSYPVNISYRDFVDEKALVHSDEALSKFHEEGLLAVEFHLSQYGTDMNAYPIIRTDAECKFEETEDTCLSEEEVAEALKFDRLYRKYGHIVLRWNQKTLKFEIGKKVPK
jgi:hypothetical protein